MSTTTAEQKIPALVLGSGVTALGVVRTLGLRGIPLFVASGAAGLERSSRWYRPVPGSSPVKTEPRLVGRLESFLEGIPLDSAVLIPCSDGLVESVSRLSPSIAARFRSSVPTPDTLDKLVDKAGLARLLARHGVPHPRTVEVECPSDAAVADEFSDAFVKPRDSQRFFARYGVKAFRPTSSGELRSLVDKVVEDGMGVVIQEYIPGPASNHYFLDGFVDRHGAVQAIFARQRLRMYPPWFGNSSALRSVHREETRPAEESLVRLLNAIGYRGIFSAEFKRDDRDGAFRLLEINARAWWYVEFATRSGVDVVSMAYDDALGREVLPVAQYQVGRTVVYPYYDFFACWSDRRATGHGLLRDLSSWVGADHTVFSWDDPTPFLAEAAGTAKRFVARRLSALTSGGSDRRG